MVSRSPEFECECEYLHDHIIRLSKPTHSPSLPSIVCRRMSVGSECWAIRGNVHGASCGFPPRDTKYCAFVLLLRHFSHFESMTGNRRCTNPCAQKRYSRLWTRFRRQSKVLTSLIQLTKYELCIMFHLPITVTWSLVVRVTRRGSYLQIPTALLPTFRHFCPPSWIYRQYFSRPFGTRPSRPAYPDSTFRHSASLYHRMSSFYHDLMDPERTRSIPTGFPVVNQTSL